MRFDRDNEFEQSLSHLVQLLKKILRNMPAQDRGGSAIPEGKDSPIQLNLCFFALVPMLPDDWEDMNDFLGPLASMDPKADEPASELSLEDLEFLRRHGIRF